MDKINLGSTIPAYPMPVSLVGAMWTASRILWPWHGLPWLVINHQGLPLPSGKAITPILELKRIKLSAFACLRRIWWR